MSKPHSDQSNSRDPYYYCGACGRQNMGSQCTDCGAQAFPVSTDERPLLVDLYCKAGGAAMGYHRAGFHVLGVDHEPQPNYPFEFVQADAIDYLLHVVETDWPFAAIHASPPCQAFTAYKRRPGHVKESPDLIPKTRELLRATGLPYVIENVEGAPLESTLMLCGSMFDPPLDVRRHRHFESNVPLSPPVWGCRHKVWGPRFPSATNRRKDSRLTVQVGSWNTPYDVQARAMGVDWKMTTEELSNAIPPAYTEFIGRQLLAYVQEGAIAA